MIYIAFETFSFKQLNKINRPLIQTIDDDIRNALDGQFRNTFNRNNSIALLSLGDERNLNSSRIADYVDQVTKIFERNKDELYGYLILIAIYSADKDSTIYSQIENLLLSVEEESTVWTNQQAHLYLSRHFTFERRLNLWQIKEHRSKEARSRSRIMLPSMRAEIVDAVLEQVLQRVNSETETSGIFLTGVEGVGKKAVVQEVAKKLFGREKDIQPLILYTIFKRQSPIHPFLNSINLDFLPHIPSLLTETENALWDEKMPLLGYLVNDSHHPKCLDRLIRDFYTAYSLYLIAYIRITQNKLLPGLFICEDMETYHPECVKMLTTLLKDFVVHLNFVPILISTEGEPNTAIPLNLQRFSLEPLDWKVLQEYVSVQYPSLSLPRSILKEIAKTAEGKPLSVLQYLSFLENEGKITKSDTGYAWIPQRDKSIDFPATEVDLSWHLLKRFDLQSISILYAICLSSGLIGKQKLYDFLQFIGISQNECDEIIEDLRLQGFVAKGDPIIPAAGYLRKKCEIILGSQYGAIKKDFQQFIVQQWREKNYQRLVLLFYFFAGSGMGDLSFEILPLVLKQKLDEGDLRGAKIFLDLQDGFFGDGLNKQDRPRLEIILKAAQLRYSLLAGDKEAISAASENAQLSLSEYPSCGERGKLLLRLATYYLCYGNLTNAVESCKRALIELHEYGKREDEGEAYIELSLAMLAEGKPDEAEEYLAIASKLLPDQSFALLRATAYGGVICFIQGKTTQAFAKIKAGISIAKAIGRREWELFLLFFEARAQFYLGNYEIAITGFTECKAFAEVYDFPDARNVSNIWLARSCVYDGKLGEGIRILKNFPGSGEALCYLAEAFILHEDHAKAIRCLDIAIKRLHYKIPYPGEKIFWGDGYASIEARCLAIERRESIISKVIRVLRAYLTVVDGDREKGINILAECTQSKNISALDANNILYHYMYSMAQGQSDSVDRLTILNKGLKFLQERTSQIISPDEKYSFTQKNRWNRLLLSEAKENRLI